MGEGGDEEAGGQADGFLGVVGFATIISFGFLEDGDEGGSGFEEGFLSVGAEMAQGVELVLWGAAAVEFCFFDFGGLSDFLFYLG